MTNRRVGPTSSPTRPQPLGCDRPPGRRMPGRPRHSTADRPTPRRVPSTAGSNHSSWRNVSLEASNCHRCLRPQMSAIPHSSEKPAETRPHRRDLESPACGASVPCDQDQRRQSTGIDEHERVTVDSYVRTLASLQVSGESGNEARARCMRRVHPRASNGCHARRCRPTRGRSALPRQHGRIIARCRHHHGPHNQATRRPEPSLGVKAKSVRAPRLGRAMAAPDAPIRLALVDDYDIVLAGLARMFDHYQQRVHVVELDARVPVASTSTSRCTTRSPNPKPTSATSRHWSGTRS